MNATRPLSHARWDCMTCASQDAAESVALSAAKSSALVHTQRSLRGLKDSIGLLKQDLSSSFKAAAGTVDVLLSRCWMRECDC